MNIKIKRGHNDVLFNVTYSGGNSTWPKYCIYNTCDKTEKNAAYTKRLQETEKINKTTFSIVARGRSIY